MTDCQGRNDEFKRLQGHVYLDHAGATPYPESLPRMHYEFLRDELLGNPHSFGSPSSQRAAELISKTRLRILQHFEASPEDYCVVFTQNATGAIRMVGENFPWSVDPSCLSRCPGPGPLFEWFFRWFRPLFKLTWKIWNLICPAYYSFQQLILLRDNHTSVVGLRELAKSKGACSITVGEDLFANLISGSNNHKKFRLFAFPAQSNFNGKRYPLEWIQLCRKKQLPNEGRQYDFTLLDASSFAATSRLRLSEFRPDFISISFYKLFGYPSSVGALIARRSALKILCPTYFGGGTVKGLTGLGSLEKHFYKDDFESRFEQGTVAFNEIPAVLFGFEVFNRLFKDIDAISYHTRKFRSILISKLSVLKHPNGERLCKVYDHLNSEKCLNDLFGPVINFNIFNQTGNPIAPSSVQRVAYLENIHIRINSFCNPGALQSFLKIDDNSMLNFLHERNAKGISCENHDLSEDGQLLGSIRVSFGASSTLRDIEQFVGFLERYFIADRAKNTEETQKSTYVGNIQSLSLFPIKSCGAFFVESWPLTKNGLIFDRDWVILDALSMKPLSQKRISKMGLIAPKIDLDKCIMTVVAPGMPILRITVKENVVDNPEIVQLHDRENDLCAVYRDEYSAWFAKFLEIPCYLAKIKHGVFKASFNKSPFLIANMNSLNYINKSVHELLQKNSCANLFDVDIMSFRPNMAIKFDRDNAFDEDNWSEIRIGNSVKFEITGGCSRCYMICNQKDGTKRYETFTHLAKIRKNRGRIEFGVYGNLLRGENQVIHLGDEVIVSCKSID